MGKITRSRNRLPSTRKIRHSLPVSLVVLAATALAAPPASADVGSDPLSPIPKHELGPTILSGTVTNLFTGQGVPGAQVTFTTLTDSFSTETGSQGGYSITLPSIGYYDVQFEATNYNPYMVMGGLISGTNSSLNATLEPVAPVVATASITGAASPGATVTASGSIVILDGSTRVSTQWTQSEGAPAVLSNPGADTTSVTLANQSAYKDELIHVLEEPPVTENELPPNVPLTGEFAGGLQDRYQVVGINHFALEKAEEITLQYTVTTSSGVYSGSVQASVELPWRVNPGLKTVPVDVPVLLHAKEGEAGHSWVITAAPAESTAELMEADTGSPWFTPDVAGVYELVDTLGGGDVTVHAGPWYGVIDPELTLDSVLAGDGRPEGNWVCVFCHSDTFDAWRQTGHAEIFTDNVNSGPGGHYGSSCFECHTVGFNTGAVNGGLDDSPDYQPFIDAGLLNSSTTAWTTILTDYPGVARLANIQCENCHGPQDGPEALIQAHMDQPGAPRVSLSADVCGSCHGEPLRHARFQQWQLSGHANYELAIDEGDSGNCSRCHTANGFLAWLPVLLGDVPGDPQGDVDVTWTAEETHPQTCVVCHDPHEAGNTSGIDTNAKIRISGSTPLLAAGFQAIGVGKGAMCMTCHNTRRGLRDDSTWPVTTDKDRAPHGGVQADLMMGRNAYFLDPNDLALFDKRAGHSFVEDTCVACHMVETPPPDILSYNQGGTNHTFFASLDSCSSCHGESFTAAGVQSGVAAQLDTLEALIASYYNALISGLIASGNSIDVNGAVVISNSAKLSNIHLSETHGRQALLFDYDGVSYGPERLSDMDVIGSPGTPNLFSFVDETVAKATWNWLLVNADSSEGIHNPSFSNQALQAATVAVAPLL